MWRNSLIALRVPKQLRIFFFCRNISLPTPALPRHPSRYSVTATIRAGVDFCHLSVSSFDLRNVIIFQVEDEQTQISVVRLEGWTHHHL